MKQTVMIFAMVSMMMMSSCAMLREHGLVDNPYPRIQPVTAMAPEQAVTAPGSLYSEQTSESNLFSDSRAMRINDIVIINITETTTASTTSTTELERSNAKSFKIPNLLGAEGRYGRIFGAGSAAATDGTLLGVSSSSEHDGSGTTQHSGNIRGSVAARVIQVMPNRYLIVQGYKNIQVNGEKTKVYISGIVNPLMISNNHSVDSDKIADLSLRLDGEGIVTAQQKPGLFSRIIDFLWPF